MTGSNGPDAAALIREALERSLDPLTDVDVVDVKITWNPTSGAEVTVTTEHGQR